MLGPGGNYAHVFELDGKAYKLFLAGPEILPRQTRDGRKRVFKSQVEAYQLLFRDPWLQNHSATFYGVCTIEDVIGGDGNSLRDDYLLDCCYALELLDLGEIDPITGFYMNEAKLVWLKHGHLTSYYENHVKDAEARFKMLGIATMDSSVLFYRDPETFKFIDFEIENYY